MVAVFEVLEVDEGNGGRDEEEEEDGTASRCTLELELNVEEEGRRGREGMIRGRVRIV